MGERTDKVSTLRLKAARTPADTEPVKPPHRGHPVTQAPPVRAVPKTAGAAPTGDLQPSTNNVTNNNFIFIISIRPPASQRLAAEPTQPMSLPLQSLGGTCGGVPSVPTLDRHVTYYTSHMLYICKYLL
jgi:hypothetical protein